jgi:hypothetical protein
MPVTVLASNNAPSALSIGTPSVLAAPNVAGRFECHIDTNNITTNDVLEWRVFNIPATGGTSRVYDYGSIQGVQPADKKIYVIGPIGNAITDTNALQFVLTQTFGTGRVVPFTVLNLEDYSQSTGSVFIQTGQLFVKKNTSLADLPFPMYDTNGNLKSGLTVTATRNIDNAGFGSCANAVTEDASHNGWYHIALNASDLNGTAIALNFAASGQKTTVATVITQS